jgi:hypothetical protein
MLYLLNFGHLALFLKFYFQVEISNNVGSGEGSKGDDNDDDDDDEDDEEAADMEEFEESGLLDEQDKVVHVM